MTAEPWYKLHPEETKIHRREWYIKHSEERKEYAKNYYQHHRFELNEANKKKSPIYWKKIRLDVMQHYSKSEVPFCACCGENMIEFLTIDHINNNGAEHRREVGTKTILWIRRNNYPDGFQVLCYNCNCAKQYSGGCPHKKQI
jgi:hypothetical protein